MHLPINIETENKLNASIVFRICISMYLRLQSLNLVSNSSVECFTLQTQLGRTTNFDKHDEFFSKTLLCKFVV